VAPRTTQQAEEPEQDEITTPESLGFQRGREIEVEPVQTRAAPDADGYVQVRMGRTIEEFTYGNPHVHYHLEAGKIYRVPVYIAEYLDSLEALYH